MTLENHFNIKRMYLLFKRNAVMTFKSIIITSAALLGLSFISSLIAVWTNSHAELHENFYLPLLWLGGLIFTSMVFKEAHSRDGIHTWLMTPASVFEKFLEKLLLSTILYVLFSLVVYVFITLFNKGVMFLLYKENLPLFNPFQPWVWKNIGHYLIIQSLFFLGAAWFRRYNFVKTVLSINVIQFVFLLLLGAVFILVYKQPMRTGFQMHLGGNAIIPGQIWNLGKADLCTSYLFTALKVFYYGLLAPFFWFLTWQRMRELEIKDGV